tara:strand:+ start:13191 stop:13469 length:279 start_codon:yes stop_codon:yes gene_type:complete
MLIKLVEVKRGMRGGTASLNEIYINSSHIISVSEDFITGETLVNEAKNLGLVENVRFSKVVLSEGNQTRILTVVGTPSEVHNKVRKRQILRG